MARACPVCGATDGTCGGTHPDKPVVTNFGRSGSLADKTYVPRQTSRRGKAGYRGTNLVVVDPDTGKEDKAATAAANKKRR